MTGSLAPQSGPRKPIGVTKMHSGNDIILYRVLFDRFSVAVLPVEYIYIMPISLMNV